MSESGEEAQNHWDRIYGSKPEAELSWHQDNPAISLELIEMAGLTTESSVIDIGGGTSGLTAALIARGLSDLTVLDLSPVALGVARRRLGPDGAGVNWIAGDVTRWRPTRAHDLWHDRAVFHFLVDAAERAAYLERLAVGLKPGGHAIIATFDPDGPPTCSGLPVMRYSPDSLSRELGPGFARIAHRHEDHLTPRGARQSFQFSLFRKAG